MGDITVHWPEMGLPAEEHVENYDVLKKWMDDPFLRKVLYTLSLLHEAVLTTLLLGMTITGLVGAYAILALPLTSHAVFWTALAVALAFLSLDRIFAKIWKSPISELSIRVTFLVFYATAEVAGVLKRSKPFNPTLSEEDVEMKIEDIPTIGLVRKRFRRNL